MADTAKTTRPMRVQLSRARGWRMPPNTRKVDRSTRWGNPWTAAGAREAGYQGTDAQIATMCAAMFRNAMHARLPACEAILDNLAELRGMNLACWCPLDQSCHADVLLEMANV